MWHINVLQLWQPWVLGLFSRGILSEVQDELKLDECHPKYQHYDRFIRHGAVLFYPGQAS